MRAAYRLRSAYTALAWLVVYISVNTLSGNARAWEDVSWTAAGSDQSWSNGDNWSSLSAPTTGDHVLFTDVGASSTVGVTTSVLQGDVSIAALQFQNGIQQYHTIDLANNKLRVDDSIDMNSSFAGITTAKITNGSLTLGSPDHVANLSVGTGDLYGIAGLDLSGASFDASLASFIVGQSTSDKSSYSVFQGGSSGTISIGTENEPGTFAVGHSVGEVYNDADVDMSQQDHLDAHLGQLLVGVNDIGSAWATVILPKENTIHADSIRVGYSSTPENRASGDLYLGNTNTIDARSVEIGVNGTGYVIAGSLTLGSADEPVDLVVGRGEGSKSYANGSVIISGPFNANLDEFSIGVGPDSDLMATTASVTFNGGLLGDIRVGSEIQPGNVTVARDNSNVTLDLGMQDSLTAIVHNFWVATSDAGATATARVTLPNQTHVQSDSIRIGYQSDVVSSGSSDGRVTVSGSAELIADELLIGSNARGVLEIQSHYASAGSLQLGNAAHPMRVVIGHATQWNSATGSLKVSYGTRIDAYLSELTVGERQGNANWAVGTFTGGQSGNVYIGTLADRGTLTIGKSMDQTWAKGTVDLSNQDELVAYLDRLDLGVADNGTAEATLRLPRNALIDVPQIRIGEANLAGSATATLELGNKTVIAADQITVGIGASRGTITAYAGSELLLGSPARPVDLTIAKGDLTGSSTYYSKVDLTGAATTAYLGNVAIGQGNSSSIYLMNGQLSLGPQSQIDARRIVLAQGNANGTLDFKGGRLTADEISKGTGSAQFNWTGGRIEIGQFGTEAIPFDLANTKQGTLAAADSFDAIHVYGNYAQGADATFEASEHQGAFRAAEISGTAKLAGTLDMRFDADFHPIVGDRFTILTATSITGKFAHVSGFFTGDTFLNPIYHSTFVELQAYRAGDGNLDGFVDGADYTAWAGHFLRTTDGGVADGDYNGDGFVNGADYILWADHFYVGSPSSVAAMAVPEPSTLALATLGLLLMAAVRRGRQTN